MQNAERHCRRMGRLRYPYRLIYVSLCADLFPVPGSLLFYRQSVSMLMMKP